MADNATLVRSFYEAWNERNFDLQAEAMAPDGIVVVTGSGERFEGPDGARRYGTAWADGFPDGTVTVDNIIASGETVVAEFTGRGTHTGTLQTSMGAIPATGRSLTLHLCDVIEFKDGKVQQQRTYFDSGSLMAQLGVTAEQKATVNQ